MKLYNAFDCCCTNFVIPDLLPDSLAKSKLLNIKYGY